MKLKETKITELLDTSHTAAAELFEGKTYPWEVLPELKGFIEKLGATLPKEEYRMVAKNIWIHTTARVAPTCALGSPAIIGPHADIRHGAFIRGSVIIGEKAVVGNSCEIKNSILFDEVQVPHYNYVGDAILGYKAHMGAGSITSNVKSDRTLVKVHGADKELDTGLKKFGAVLGDNVEIGCNSVLNPGTVVGRNSIVYPLSSVRGCVDANSIYKAEGNVAARENREEGEKAPAKAPAKRGRKKASSLEVVK